MNRAAHGAQTKERILEAAYACMARWGLSRTSIEDVTKEAALSRATFYRYFPGGRDELLSSVIDWEHQRFFARLYEAVQDSASLEELLERGLRFAHRAIAEHDCSNGSSTPSPSFSCVRSAFATAPQWPWSLSS